MTRREYHHYSHFNGNNAGRMGYEPEGWMDYPGGRNVIGSVEEDVETAPVIDTVGDDSSEFRDSFVSHYRPAVDAFADAAPNDWHHRLGEEQEGEEAAPSWARQYLGDSIADNVQDIGHWNNCVDGMPPGRRRGSLEPMSAKVWEHDGRVGMDDYGVYYDDYEAPKEEIKEQEREIKDHREPGLGKPDKGVALNERYKRQLRTYEKDQYGVPLASTARKFSFFASPSSISEVCTGLGVYLTNIRAAIVLTTFMALLMIYPLVDNIKTQNWSQRYYLYTQPELPTETCEKGYWNTVYSSWIIKTSNGGHCDGGPYTSPYGCSSKCVWDSSRLTSKSQCSSINYSDLLSTLTQSSICSLHMPCLPDSDDVNAPDGPCLCCNFELSKPTSTNDTDIVILENNQERVSASRFWMLFLTQLVFMGWLLALLHFQVKIVQSNGNNVVGPSDFSVWIRGIKHGSANDSYLRKWCQQFGPIMAAFNVPSVGEAIRVGRQVEDILIRKEEADADPGHKSWNPLLWIYRRFLVGKPEALKDKLEDRKIKLKIFERQETTPTGYALATFRYTDAASACLSTFDTSIMGRFFELCTCGLTSTKPLLHGSAVEVTRAPEPSDMIWEHTECGYYEVLKRRIISWTITICVVMAGAGIQYGLASGAERLREDRYIADIAAGNGDEYAEREAAMKTTRIRIVTILTGIMVVIINFSTMLTVRFLAWYERWTTRTSMERWVLLKLSVSQLINAFAAPLIAAYVSGNKSGWFVRGGLMEAAFFVQCSNALLPPLVHFLGIGDNFKFYVLAPFARTQVRHFAFNLI